MFALRSPVGPIRPFLLVFAAALLLAVPAAAHASAVPDHITVSVSPAKVTLGQPVTVTATVKAANNATISDYSGPADLQDNAGALDSKRGTDFVNGISRTTTVLTGPVNGDIIAVGTAGVGGQSGRFSVVGPLHHFDVQLPTSIDSGSPATATATARDLVGNVVTSFEDKADVRDSAGELSAGELATFTAGVAHDVVQFSGPAKGDQLAVGYPGVGGLSRAFTVVGPLDHVDVSVPSSATTIAPFTVTARARDALGSLVAGYNGPATWSDHTNNLSAAAPADFVAGVSTTSVNEPDAYHADVISVSSAGSGGSSKAFNITGPWDHIDVTGVPASIHVGAAFTLTAYAHDTANNIVPTFEDSVRWLMGPSFDNGELGFVHGVSRTTIALSTPEHQQPLELEVPPSGTGRQTGRVLTRPIDVIGAVDHFQLTWKRSDGWTGCNTITITGSVLAKAVDRAGNFVTDYQNPQLAWSPAPLVGGIQTPAPPAPFVNGVSWNPKVSFLGDFYGHTGTVAVTLGTSDVFGGPVLGGAFGNVTLC